MRRELSGLDWGDLDQKAGKFVVKKAKGNRNHIAFLPPGAQRRVQARIKVRGDWAGPLFTSKNGNLGWLAGVAHFSTHDLRRTMISALLDRGVDLGSVQKMVGHRRPETTARYDRRGDERKREAAALLDTPPLRLDGRL